MYFVFSLMVRAARRWYVYDGERLAAALSYYTPFALAPLIFVTMTVLSVVYGRPFVVDMLLLWGSVLGPELRALMQEATVNFERHHAGLALPIVGTVFFLSMIIVALNTLTSGFHHLWQLPHRGFVGWLNTSWRSLVFVFVLQAYLFLLMAAEGVYIHTTFSSIPIVMYLITFLATTILCTLLYLFLPALPLSRRACLVGGVVASTLFLLARSGVSLYIELMPTPQLFGAAGLIVVLLIWIYVTASIIYYGACVAFEYHLVRRSERFSKSGDAV